MAKLAEFQRVIGRHARVSQRTVRRWCETGKLPGVYQTKGGHWRLIGPCLKQLRQADESFRKASPKLRRIYKASFEQQRRWLRELAEVLQVSSVLGHAQEFRPDVPIRQCLHPRAIEAVEHPTGLLMIHAEKLHSEQTPITPKALARSLQISVATLYRRYNKTEGVKRVCKHDTPRPDGQVRFDQSGPVPVTDFDYDAVRVAA